MTDRLFVQIDMQSLITNMMMQDNAAQWGPDAVKAWLSQEGFVEQENGWLCSEQALTRLDKCEIISVVRV